MWEDEKSGNDSDKHETHADQDETMPTFEEFKAAVEKDYLATQNTEVSRRYDILKEHATQLYSTEEDGQCCRRNGAA